MVPDGGAVPWAPAYLRARSAEGRLYPDDVVARLPVVRPSDPLAWEWRIRAGSAARLAAYLGRGPRPLRILDAGCGNGWLAARLAAVDGAEVVGIDANELELAQARRVFGGRANLRFELGDLETAEPPADYPTVVVLASAAQYVADLGALIRRLEGWLAPGGEIHIIDTPFYGAAELGPARQRTARHYLELGVPEMASVYQHHGWDSLAPFKIDVLHDPSRIRTRLARRVLGRPPSPFPWIRIRE